MQSNICAYSQSFSSLLTEVDRNDLKMTACSHGDRQRARALYFGSVAASDYKCGSNAAPSLRC